SLGTVFRDQQSTAKEAREIPGCGVIAGGHSDADGVEVGRLARLPMSRFPHRAPSNRTGCEVGRRRGSTSGPFPSAPSGTGPASFDRTQLSSGLLPVAFQPVRISRAYSVELQLPVSLRLVDGFPVR